MRKFSRFDTGIWAEPWFRELPDDSPLLWLWLNHNRATMACGLWRIDLRQASQATLLPERDIARWLEAWQRLGLLRGDGQFVLLPQFFAQQGGSPVLAKRARREAAALACETQLAVEWIEGQRGASVGSPGMAVGSY